VVTLIFKWFAEHIAVPPTLLVDWCAGPEE